MGPKEIDSSKDIFVGNIPTNVEYVSVLGSIATHLSQLLSRHEDIKKVTSELKGSDTTSTAELSIKKKVVASIRLVFSDKKGKALACRGFGFLTLTTDEFTPEDIVKHLSSLAKEEPLKTTLPDGTTHTANLLFKYGSAGTTDTDKESMLKEKKAELVHSAGQQLLERVNKKGGTMHIREWSSQQKGFNLMGKKVKITPSDVAKSAGMDWNGETQLFSLKIQADADQDEKKDDEDVAPVTSMDTSAEEESSKSKDEKKPKKKRKSEKKSSKKQPDEKIDDDVVAPVAEEEKEEPKKKRKSEKKSSKKQPDEKIDDDVVAPVAEEDKDEKEEPKKKRKSEKKSSKKPKKVRKE